MVNNFFQQSGNDKQPTKLAALKSYIIGFVENHIIAAARKLAVLPNANKPYLDKVESSAANFVEKHTPANQQKIQPK